MGAKISQVLSWNRGVSFMSLRKTNGREEKRVRLISCILAQILALNLVHIVLLIYLAYLIIIHVSLLVNLLMCALYPSM